ncbi:hypothetical protein FHS91_002497 [Sphingobium xanthum]|uniref:DUF5623 domain-containing protein n=1 Tax=Sphingobium xanthum TaxID=1387165 RepID=UPI001C8C434E|nr:DUF5623 domain-containing protein [Sphingobium xanthum]
MLIEDIRPSTIAGIKRLARRISKAEGVPHKEALERAARAASFENLKHAKAVLAAASRPPAHQLFLTAYWTDRETYAIGRETLEIWLSKPLLDLCTKSEMRIVRGLSGLRLAAPDHLLEDMMCQSQDFARDQLCQAARALRFMEATGLRPCDDRRQRESAARLDTDLPRKDHGSGWLDPATDSFVLVDEPYSDAKVSDERADWARRNGWQIRAAVWPGMYFPYRCALFVAVDTARGLDFEALMQRINALPDPVTTVDWSGVSVADHRLFCTPLTLSSQDRRRAKAKGTINPRSSSKTVPFHRSFIGAARKPNGKLSLAGHEAAGRMIAAVLQSRHKPWAVNEQMDKLCSILVDWLYADVPHSVLDRLHDPVDIYYSAAPDEALIVRADSAVGVVDILSDLKTLLAKAYPESAPLRRQIARITRASKITLAKAAN